MYNNPPRSHEYHTMEGQDDIEIGGESDKKIDALYRSELAVQRCFAILFRGFWRDIIEFKRK